MVRGQFQNTYCPQLQFWSAAAPENVAAEKFESAPRSPVRFGQPADAQPVVLPKTDAQDIPNEVIFTRGHDLEYRAYWIGSPDPERALRDAYKLIDEQRANHGSGLARALGEEELIDLMQAKAISKPASPTRQQQSSHR